jgi:hypothetical protein
MRRTATSSQQHGSTRSSCVSRFPSCDDDEDGEQRQCHHGSDLSCCRNDDTTEDFVFVPAAANSEGCAIELINNPEYCQNCDQHCDRRGDPFQALRFPGRTDESGFDRHHADKHDFVGLHARCWARIPSIAVRSKSVTSETVPGPIGRNQGHYEGNQSNNNEGARYP